MPATMGRPRTVEKLHKLDRGTLLNLLAMYETAIRELEGTDDPRVSGLLRRLERHRTEVISALTPHDLRPDE
jgi:hypothetical protein